MLDMIYEKEEQIKYTAEDNISNSQILSRDNVSSTMSSFLESRVSELNEKKVNSCFSNQKKDSDMEIVRSSVKSKSETSFNSIFSDKNFIDEVNEKSKIENLNFNILKMNEIIEQNLRKINTIEKENQLLKKKLSESEGLNLKLIKETSEKNNIFEDLIKKNLELSKILSKSSYQLFQKQDYLVKAISDRILKNINKQNMNEKLHDYLNDFLKNTEIKILISNPNAKYTPKSSMKSCLSKPGKSINKVTFKENTIDKPNYKFEEMNFTQDIHLKNLIVRKAFSDCKSTKIKSNSSKLLPYIQLMENIFQKEDNIFQEGVCTQISLN